MKPTFQKIILLSVSWNWIDKEQTFEPLFRSCFFLPCLTEIKQFLVVHSSNTVAKELIAKDCYTNLSFYDINASSESRNIITWSLPVKLFHGFCSGFPWQKLTSSCWYCVIMGFDFSDNWTDTYEVNHRRRIFKIYVSTLFYK